MTAPTRRIPSFAGAGRNAAKAPNVIYELFIALVTLLSVVVVVLTYIVPLPTVDAVLRATDSMICVIFLVDVVRSLSRAPDRRAYLFGERIGRSVPYGLIETISSLPPVGVFRLLRVVRLREVTRVVGHHRPRYLLAEFLARRAESAAYVIVLAALVTLCIGGSLIAVVEPPAADSNIKTGGDAFWWAFVTITTVGYGDKYPVTEAGRLIGMVTMAVGVGILGVLSSFLAKSFLAPEHHPVDDLATTVPEPGVTAAAASMTDPTAPDPMNPVEPTDVPAPDDLPIDPVEALTLEVRAMRAELAEISRRLDGGAGSLSG